MSAPFLAARLQTSPRPGGGAGTVVVLGEVGSTNDEVKRLAVAGAPAGTVVIADRQTAGRGRLGRRWHSPPGAGLYLSLLLRPDEPLDRIGRYAISAAVAVREACARFVASGLALKWPNDLLGSGRKLAGILAEARTGDGGTELVIGIGVNVAQRAHDFPADLDVPATSLALLSGGAPPERERVASAVLESLADVEAALARGAWDEIAERFERYAPAARGAAVRLASGERGTTAGLDRSGALRIRTPSATVLVHAGESIRAIGG